MKRKLLLEEIASVVREAIDKANEYIGLFGCHVDYPEYFTLHDIQYPVNIIENDTEQALAYSCVEALMSKGPPHLGTPEGEMLEDLVRAIDNYEKRNFVRPKRLHQTSRL